mgnify:CR=1 FL=1
MNSSDFEFLSSLLYKQSGLVLTPDKGYLLETRLQPVARSHGLSSIEQIVSTLRSRRDEKLVNSITDAMTTNESLFFRDRTPFDQFKTVVLPSLLQSRAAKKSIRIWSAACSSGQEPYSLSMVLDELASKLTGWRVEIIATDISTEMVARARSGIYSQFEVQRGLPIQLLVLTEDPFVSPALFCDHGTFLDRLWRRDLAVPHWLPFKDPALLASHIREFVLHMEGAPETPALARARKRAHPPKGKYGGRQLLITGAGGGIGRQTALAFAREGADVIVSDINPEAAEETAALIRDLGVDAKVFIANVADRADMDALARFVDEEAGPVDLVVNNAGIGMAGGQLEMTREAWDRVLGINLGGLIEGSRLFGERMVAARSGGHIVNVVSASAFAPTRAFPAYAVSKAAALMQTESLRGELAEHKIGVTAACPGFVDTGIAQATEYVGASEDDQKARRNKADTMYKRRAFTPEQVAKAILKAVEKNKPIALIGAEAYIARTVQRFFPSLGRQFAKVSLPQPDQGA